MQATANHAASGGCTHHWIIATPNGHLSRGVCKRCGCERDFENSESELAARKRNFTLKGGQQVRRQDRTLPA